VQGEAILGALVKRDKPHSSAGGLDVDIRLKEIEPMAYSFLLNFAKDNELQVRPGRGEKRPDEGT